MISRPLPSCGGTIDLGARKRHTVPEIAVIDKHDPDYRIAKALTHNAAFSKLVERGDVESALRELRRLNRSLKNPEHVLEMCAKMIVKGRTRGKRKRM